MIMHEHQVTDYPFENFIVFFIPSLQRNILPRQFQYRCDLRMQFVILHLKFQLFYALFMVMLHFLIFRIQKRSPVGGTLAGTQHPFEH